ncbi:alpha/beta hydrolase [Hydrogenimonas sp. SS33]|uniref:alpha/beta hydrolase n=1 Tax=Hydrogenimonas leucolamina TaxID=2954236 RepID=UPI00336C26E4
MNAALAAALLAALALYPFYVVHRQTAGTHTQIVRSPAEWGVPYQKIDFTTDDGILLKGWWIPAESLRAVLLLHGKAGSRNGEYSGIFELARRYRDAGFSVMMADMRGHGESGGDRVYFGVRESRDLSAWVASLDPRRRYRWGIHGFSMGAVTAMMMQEREPGRFAFVVADAPWTDFEVLVKQELWKRALLPPFAYPYVRWIAETFFGQDFSEADNRTRVKKLCGKPVLYIREKEDDLLPAYQWKRLRLACPGAEVVEYKGVGHVEAFRNDPDAYWRRVEDFLKVEVF